MNVKYCKNCSNFSPIFRKDKLKPDEEHSWGYCRVINRLQVKDNKVQIVPQSNVDSVVERTVAVNQVIIVNDEKICPAYCNLSDIFNPEDFINTSVSDLSILKELNYVKCKNCFHIFASPEDKILDENDYICPICYHKDTFKYHEHFKVEPKFFKEDYGF